MANLLEKLRKGPAQRLARESMGDRDGALPPAAPAPADDPEAGWTRDRVRGVMLLELSRIRPDPNQPRKQFDQDELDRLAGSVRARGILQPVRVRWDAGAGLWVLIAGECRYRSAKAAELSAIPAMRVEGLASPADVLEDQIAEQLLRSTWSPIEEAAALRSIMEARGWQQWELCRALHLSSAGVSRSMTLLELDGRVQELVHRRELGPTTAIELRKLEPEQQLAVAQAVIGEKLTVPQTVERVAAVRGKPERAPRIAHARRVIKLPRGAGKVIVALASGATDGAEVLKALELARSAVSGHSGAVLL
jgi:ParB family chromosome partitioning protein